MEVLENKKQGERQGGLKGRRKDGRMEGGTKEECEDFLSDFRDVDISALYTLPFSLPHPFFLSSSLELSPVSPSRKSSQPRD